MSDSDSDKNMNSEKSGYSYKSRSSRELEQQLSSNSNPSTASRRNPSSTDRIPFVPASFATSLTYNDYNTMPSLVPDMERRSRPTFQLPAKSKRCVCSLFLLAGITMYQ
ncbi:hypothetical protein TNCV_1125451 [Trichonephila clavipes]|nr:hypothetical protein TNCV_1125451 [Trichonephila clavipes]